jgi:hypothetical protein
MAWAKGTDNNSIVVVCEKGSRNASLFLYLIADYYKISSLN